MTTELRMDEISDRLFALRDKLRELDDERKQITEQINSLKVIALARADEQGATRISTATGTLIVTETEVPNVNDWEEVWKYIVDNDAYHLVQKRINSAAYRELLKLGEELPGADTYVKRDVNFRAAR